MPSAPFQTMSDMPSERRLPTLRELYASHAGKVSDKWSLYLDVYERVLAHYRHRPVAFVEVGVQNGGSLELWARYLPLATVLVGCDIDPKCGGLVFDDPRISVVVGDANTDAAYRSIRARAPTYDIFIDDGSHTSRDIVLGFCNFFRHVKPGGVYIVEDLHCSYMPQWGGGIDRGDTSMEFMKVLADFVNLPYWQRDRAPASLLDPFFPEGTRPDLAAFRDILSVGFYDSMCVVEKRAEGAVAGLGARVIVGTDASVSADPLAYRDAQRS